jgi:hypothetical protein
MSKLPVKGSFIMQDWLFNHIISNTLFYVLAALILPLMGGGLAFLLDRTFKK